MKGLLFCLLFSHLSVALSLFLSFCLSRIKFFSSLWLLSQLMEYSYLLDMADDCEDPYMRLVYTCKCIFLLLVSICSERSVKMISETDYMMQLLGRYLFTMLISEHGSLLIPSLVKHMKWPITAALHLLRSRSINFSLPPVLWWYLCSCVWFVKKVNRTLRHMLNHLFVLLIMLFCYNILDVFLFSEEFCEWHTWSRFVYCFR